MRLPGFSLPVLALCGHWRRLCTVVVIVVARTRKRWVCRRARGWHQASALKNDERVIANSWMQKYFSLIWMDKIFFHSGALSQECNIKEGGSPQSDISWLQDGAKRMNCQDFSSAYASAKRAVKGPVACSHPRQSPDNGSPSPPGPALISRQGMSEEDCRLMGGRRPLSPEISGSH